MAIAPGKEAGQGTASVVAGWLLLVVSSPYFGQPVGVSLVSSVLKHVLVSYNVWTSGSI